MSREKMLRNRARQYRPFVPAHIMDAVRRRLGDDVTSLERWRQALADEPSPDDPQHWQRLFVNEYREHEETRRLLDASKYQGPG